MFEAHWYEWLAAIVCVAILFGDDVLGDGGRVKAATWVVGAICVVLLGSALYLIATLPK